MLPDPSPASASAAPTPHLAADAAPRAAPGALIVVGTSAGGMPALIDLVQQLPAGLPAAVLVVQHLAPDQRAEYLVARLGQHTGLSCRQARHGERLQAGCLYLAPPDRHLLVGDSGQLLVTKGPHENGYRPAADTLFRSAAVAYGPRVVGVVLTGMLHDGTAGLDYIKRCGGRAVVQDPADAEFPSMPESALRHVAVDYVVPVSSMGPLLREMALNPPAAPPGAGTIPDDLRVEANIAERIVGTIEEVNQLGHPASITCPDCGGSLWELKAGNVLRYRCHTGHAFTAQALLESGQHLLEESLWVALRQLEERRNLLSSMATRGEGPYSVQQQERIAEIKTHINRLREFLLNGTSGPSNASANGTAPEANGFAPGANGHSLPPSDPATGPLTTGGPAHNS
ncbi:chemotaxis protein CheB [uncultured Hymenobacter sp.]|uniref:chemotaxis protein CheB n=1 Tax=uncultured Hymenobacter sp. TaxID=170016 RepID=UPI0035CBA4F2